MTIDENTKLADIMAAYPWLPAELERTEPRAKPYLALMDNPLARGLMKNATVADAAKHLGRPAERLLGALAALIRDYESREGGSEQDG